MMCFRRGQAQYGFGMKPLRGRCRIGHKTVMHNISGQPRAVVLQHAAPRIAPGMLNGMLHVSVCMCQGAHRRARVSAANKEVLGGLRAGPFGEEGGVLGHALCRPLPAEKGAL